jgi:hypothetical protein
MRTLPIKPTRRRRELPVEHDIPLTEGFSYVAPFLRQARGQRVCVRVANRRHNPVSLCGGSTKGHRIEES